MAGTKGGAPAARVGCWLSVPLLLAGLAGCATTGTDQADINTRTKFASADMGVAASPRVTTKKTARLGGGRYQVGDPYQVAGKWYHPKANPDYDKVGTASWYGPNFHGRLTANGEIYNEYMLTAANPTLPLPCYARVTNEQTGDSVIVRVNDRGPFAKGRIIDLSRKAARLLHMKNAGTAKVRVRYIGMAPLDGDDSAYLMASYRPGPGEAPVANPDTGNPGTMLAMNDAPTPGLPGVTIEDADTAVAASAGAPAPASISAEAAAAALKGRPEPISHKPAIMTAMASTPTLSPAEQGIEQALLPEVGPVPVERPVFVAQAAAKAPQAAVASAYTSRRVKEASIAFDQLLAQDPDNGQLTPEAIVRAWNKGMIAQN